MKKSRVQRISKEMSELIDLFEKKGYTRVGATRIIAKTYTNYVQKRYSKNAL